MSADSKVAAAEKTESGAAGKCGPEARIKMGGGRPTWLKRGKRESKPHKIGVLARRWHPGWLRWPQRRPPSVNRGQRASADPRP